MKKPFVVLVTLFLFSRVDSKSQKKVIKEIHTIVSENKETLKELKDSLNECKPGCSDDWQFFNKTNLCYKRFTANELELTLPGWMGARLYCIEQGVCKSRYL